jgi:Ca-activated chloride channel family protein
LWLLLLIPALVAAYVYALRRKKKSALRYASLLLVRDAMTRGQALRRHLPPALFLLAMVTAILAMARPTAIVSLLSPRTTIILSMDVSKSMQATDVAPNRLAAAQSAAKSFIEDLPRGVRVGIVAFAGTASVVQSPTDNRDDLTAAVDRFQLQRATATGSGLLLALAQLLPDAGIDVESTVFDSAFSRSGDTGLSLDKRKAKDHKDATPMAPGSYPYGAIILLSDGRRTTGPDPLAVAKMAAERGVRVYTVGFGTVDGGSVDFGEMSFYMRLDEETLKAIASLTGGTYFHAGSATDLHEVYRNLGTRFSMERSETEISALFAAGAAFLIALGSVLSLLWFRQR